jgi:hypothetical protein
MLKVSRREYKVMLDHRMFLERKQAAESFCGELHACAERFKGVACDGQFEKTKKREIVFLDTSDNSVNLNGFVFRQRVNLEADRAAEYTLKCRSPDRYVASGADVRAAKGLKEDSKLEEDIGAPFVVRFSHSTTVVHDESVPPTLQDAAELFGALGKLKRDGNECSGDLKLRPVNGMRAFERVLVGPALQFGKTAAEVALILWSDGADGRPLVGEFSFRYANEEEDYSSKDARLAMKFFLELQRLDWCLPGARTKTQYAYRDA